MKKFTASEKASIAIVLKCAWVFVVTAGRSIRGCSITHSQIRDISADAVEVSKAITGELEALPKD